MGSPQTSRAGRRARRLRASLPWLALFASAVLVRSMRFGLVFVDGTVRFPVGADELYHMRRIWFSVVNFPAWLDFDYYLNHPEGAASIWPPAFDWSIAALARLLVGAGDQHAVEVVAAWTPPLLGGLAVVAAAWLARRSSSPAAGWVTGALLVPLPAHVLHSALGMVDHHVAVGLFATLLVAAAMRLAGPLEGGRARGALASGGMIAAAILLWPGFLLHVLVVQAFLVVQLLATRERAIAVARARALALAHGLAAALLLPFCAGREWRDFGSLSPLMLSDFQPLWFGAGAVALALVAALWSRPRLGEERIRRVGAASGLAALGLALAWFGVPGLAAALENAAGWFEADPFLAVIDELEPLLVRDGRFEPSLGHDRFSYLFWGYPLALVGLAGQALRCRRADLLLLLTWSAAFCAATLYQKRFNDVFAAGFVLVIGPALVAGVREARRRFGATRAVVALATVLATTAALLPYAAAYRTATISSLAALRGDRLSYGSPVRLQLVTERAARWLRRATLPTRGYLDPTAKPEYGVLCAWGRGHLLRYYSERPMVQDNFGPWGGRNGFEAARRYFESRDEGEAAAIGDGLGARYVVATLQGSGQAPPQPGSMALRLALERERGRGLAFPGRPSEALGRHRLVFVADDADLPRPHGEPSWTAAVYEIVPGARVVGRAPGRAAIEFAVGVRLAGRRPLSYRARVRVDDSGSYQIRLPYPSAEGYAVRSSSQRSSLVLSEADVREGRTVAGPSFLP